MMDDSEAILVGLIADAARLDRSGVTSGKRLREDLGIDSLSLIDLAIAIQDRLAVAIPDEVLERLQSVGDLANYARSGPAARVVVPT